MLSWEDREMVFSRLKVGAAIALLTAELGQSQTPDKTLDRFRETYKELVETNTTFSSGDCTLAVRLPFTLSGNWLD